MNNFNLKKFLTENKLTSLSNDKGINENLSPAEQEKVSSELSNYVEKHKPDFGEVAEIADMLADITGLPVDKIKDYLMDLTGGDDTMKFNEEKDIKHDCANHVLHEKYGHGLCLEEQHTLLEDGTVTHYDVFFKEGSKTVKNIPVEELNIITSSHHGHKRKKK